MKQKTQIRTTIQKTYFIDAKTLLEKLNLPEDSKISFQVPSGGDYSGVELDLDDSEFNGGNGLKISHTITREEILENQKNDSI